jgi:signal transduction histidine kinase
MAVEEVVTCGTMSPVPHVSRTPTAAAVQRRMELGLGAVRGLTLAWAVVVAVIDARSAVLSPAAPAFLLLGVLAVWSAAWTVAVERGDRWVAGPGAVVDVALAALVVGADELLGGSERSQSLGSAWPLVAVLATGVAAGPLWGLAGGMALGLTGVVVAALDGGLSGRMLALCGAWVLYAGAGWVAGWVAAQLRETAEYAAAAEARAEVARTLHDGVLQTLAVVQRRSDDAELVALARDQDREQRAFLRGTTDGSSAGRPDEVDTVGALAPVLQRVESLHGVSVRLVVIEEGGAVGRHATALAAAVGEAVTNAARHSGADVVWVSVDRRGSGTEVVVHDEGRGFDTTTTPEGDGLRRSVRQRLEAVGGAMEVRSSPGAGCDVTLWVP